MSLIRNTSWSAVAAVTNSVGRLAITAVVARRLGPDAFGALIFIQWIIEISYVLFSVGLSGVATRFYPQFHTQDGQGLRKFDRWFFRAAVTATTASVILGLVGVAHFSSVSSALDYFLIALWAMASAAWSLVSSRAQGMFEFKSLGVASIAFTAVGLTAVVMLPENVHLGTVVALYAAANFAASALCYALCRRNAIQRHSNLRASIDPRDVRTYALNTWAALLLSSFVWARGEISVMKHRSSDAEIGHYSVGLTISALVNQAVSLLAGALWPPIAKAWDARDYDTLNRLSLAFTELLLLTSAFGAGFVICFSPYLVELMFGPSYRSSVDLVCVLAVGTLALSCNCVHAVNQAATNGSFGRNSLALAAPALIGLALLVSSSYGAEGVALVRCGVLLGLAFVTLSFYQRLLPAAASMARNQIAFLAVVAMTGYLVVRLSGDASLSSRVLHFLVFCTASAAVTSVRRDSQLRREVMNRWRRVRLASG